jgi:hypothetical protein
MRLFFYIAMSILISLSSAAFADSGRDRCEVTDCLCLVRRGELPDFSYQRYTQNRRHEIFFQEGSSTISRYQGRELAVFVSNQSQLSPSVTVIGYTDGCGGAAYNRTLATRRARIARDRILLEMPNARVSTQIEGEATNNHDPDSRKVDVIFHTSNYTVTSIERIPADVYLLDASGSMLENMELWTRIINASFKQNSRIYLSMMSGCRNGNIIDSVSPQGGTEIWYSYWKVLDYMDPGETLLIVSDFDSNFPLSSSERRSIDEKVRLRGIRVFTVSY